MRDDEGVGCEVHVQVEGALRRVGRRALVVASLVGLLALAGGGVAPRLPAAGVGVAAAAGGGNRAAVLVDKGDGSPARRVCVRFDAASITGEEALRLAAAEDPSLAPVLSDFAGKGKAVCALCGIGCPAGDCFCDPERFWAYSRAEQGTTALRTSPVGVSSTTVTDGDVEAYRWGSGAAPAFADIRTVCGEVPAPTTTSPPAPAPAAPAPTTVAAAPPPPPPPTSAPAAAPSGGGTTTAPPPPPSEVAQTTTSTTTSPDATTTTARAADDSNEAAQDAEVAAPDDDADGGTRVGGSEEAVRLTQEGEPGGGSAIALAGVGATLAALVGGAAVLRARRQG